MLENVGKVVYIRLGWVKLGFGMARLCSLCKFMLD